jgi:hypothetical protein
MNIFEQACRLKLRFHTDQKGLISSEDLWDLPLTSQRGISLDGLAIGLHKAMRDVSDIPSFVDKPATTNSSFLNETQLKLDIVKHVIGVKIAERDAAASAAANREKKQQILELIARKENDALAGQSLEDLRKLANSL